jgi:hypothetical protein
VGEIRILIADDSKLIRGAIKNLLIQDSIDWVICGEVDNGEGAVREVGKLFPDVLLLDVSISFASWGDGCPACEKRSPRGEGGDDERARYSCIRANGGYGGDAALHNEISTGDEAASFAYNSRRPLLQHPIRMIQVHSLQARWPNQLPSRFGTSVTAGSRSWPVVSVSGGPPCCSALIPIKRQ